MPIINSTTKKVLNCMLKGPDYGYSMAKKLNMNESFLYRVLRRLKKEDYITYEKKVRSGRIRKYCKLTAKGRKLAEAV